MRSILSIPLLLSLPLLACSLPIGKRSISAGAAINENFPDPTFLTVSSISYAYSTNNGAQNIPVATSNNFITWTVLSGVDALPDAGSWSNGQNVWAPSVIEVSSGSFVLYYAATLADGTTHCIGAATSTSPTGPFEPQSEALICPSASVGGAIDPAGFLDPATSNRYIVYKIDGNSVGHGGECGNTVSPIVPTPIMVQQVDATDGITLIGSPQQILTQDPSGSDGPLIEAPSLTYADGVYFLFYSSHCYSSDDYNIRYAISENGVLNGGNNYTPATGVLLQGGSSDGNGGQLYSPGGLTVGPVGAGGSDQPRVVFMADIDGDEATTRGMWSGTLSLGVSGGVGSVQVE